MASIEELRKILRLLRDPERGCPWDREQSFATIAPYTIEEAYEVEDAIRREAWPELCDELGDLLLQVAYHTQMAEEAGHFAFDDVVSAICGKLVRRHPHVFQERGDTTASEVARTWEALKAEERRAGDRGPLDGIPQALPALLRAAKLERRAIVWDVAEPEAPAELADLESLSAQQLAAVIAACARRIARLGLDPEALLREENARREGRLRRSGAEGKMSQDESDR